LACFSVLEAFVVRRAFNGDETKEYNKLFVEVVSSLLGRSGAEVKPALEAKLLSGGGTTRAWPTNDEIVERALSASIYEAQKQPMLRLIFERLELRMRGKKSEDEEIPTNLQIEHVMPQSWYAHWPINGNLVSSYHAAFPSALDEKQLDLANAIRARNSVINTLGNLTLLNRYLNPAASNGSFELKRSEYAHSVLRLNRYFDGRSEWNEAAIRERGRVLGEMITAIWLRP
jgi:hypothetical protein